MVLANMKKKHHYMDALPANVTIKVCEKVKQSPSHLLMQKNY